MENNIADVLFSEAVRKVQQELGSREQMARLEARNHWEKSLTDDVIDFIAKSDSFYLATASLDGQPYIQHRGGKPGFVKVIDEHSIIWPEYPGNRQFISTGNLSENDKAFLFFMDYNLPRRIKLWGRAYIIGRRSALFEKLVIQEHDSMFNVERVCHFRIEAWDENCRQYITPRI